MTAVSTSAQKDLRNALVDMAKNGREGYANFFKDAGLGKPEPNDQQFLMWWQLHTDPHSPNYDPDWVRCLQYVQGGKQLLAKYERLTTPQPAPPSTNVFLPQTLPPAATGALTPPAGPMKPLAQGDAFYQPDHETAAIAGQMGAGS